ncbi:MAG: 3-dehydroquinate synthase [Brotaphodocola sp.]
MAKRITVHRDGTAIYDIVIETSMDKLGQEVAKLGIAEGRKLCIVTDTNVAPLYLEQVKAQLEAVCMQIDEFVFSAGEEHKNLNTVRNLYEFLILKHYDRQDILVALGGGVVGDLTGFTAATYLRGISFIQIPTTLLAQVDSSIGGKTGVDFDAYKNMVGAFHMPKLVYTSLNSLTTLTEEQFACGMGEVIKHGMIKNRAYYDWMIENAELIVARNLDVCEEMIYESNLIKRDVVEQDPTEKGDRALLNFGHTLGHAIEKLMNFKLLHGQCVALGCAAASYLSAIRGNISMEEAVYAREIFRKFELPVSIGNLQLDIDQIIDTTKSDKKMDSNRIKFILLRSIGNAFIDKTVSDEEMKECLIWLMGGQDER